MSLKLDVRGKSREQIGELLRSKRRDGLLDLIYQLANIEDHFTPLEVARARRMEKYAVVALCRDGKIPGTHKPSANQWRISASGLEEWDRSTCVTPLNGKS
jgi:hypothetical protein